MNADSYSTRQRERDAQYRHEYATWVAALSDAERRKLKANGLGAPSIPSAAGGTMSDIASSPLARCEAEDYDADFDDPNQHHDKHCGEPEQHDDAKSDQDKTHGHAAPQAADSEFLHDLLRRLVGELIMQDNARLSLECLALVTGLIYEGDSMTAIGRRHGITRAAVSKRCVNLAQSLNLKPSRAMRSLKARESCRKARIRRLKHLHRHP